MTNVLGNLVTAAVVYLTAVVFCYINANPSLIIACFTVIVGLLVGWVAAVSTRSSHRARMGVLWAILVLQLTLLAFLIHSWRRWH